MDCFRCPFDDCINDELTYQEIKQSEVRDKEINKKPKSNSGKRKKRVRTYTAEQLERRREYYRKYYREHREEINAKRRANYDKEKDLAYKKFLNERARFELLRDQWKY